MQKNEWKNCSMKTKNKEKSTKNHKIFENLSNFYHDFVYFFDRLLFPDDIKCIFCHRDIANFHEKPYCESCAKKIGFNNGNRCRICDSPIENEAKICDYCQKNKRHFLKAFCPLIYSDIVRENILEYKSGNKRYLAKAYAIIISDYIKKIVNKIDIITYVPITKHRLKERSFNQSQKLAEEISKIIKKPVVECLIKNFDTHEQKTLTYDERQKNLKSCFSLKNDVDIKDKTILLVDDIITTCATVNVCSEILSKKAKAIYVTAIARNKLKEKQQKNIE